jgi:hypothetical protein
MDDLTQRIVEAAVRSYFDAPGSRMKWHELSDLGRKHATEAFEHQFRAAHALAEQEGVIFTRVPGLEEPDPAMSPSIQHWADGYNAHRAATLAGKVPL